MVRLKLKSEVILTIRDKFYKSDPGSNMDIILESEQALNRLRGIVVLDDLTNKHYDIALRFHFSGEKPEVLIGEEEDDYL